MRLWDDPPRLSIPGNMCAHCGTIIGESVVCAGCGWVDPLTTAPDAPRKPKDPEARSIEERDGWLGRIFGFDTGPGTSEHEQYKCYRRRPTVIEATPWHPRLDTTDVSISVADLRSGSPRRGDMIAREPGQPGRWLVNERYFAEHYRRDRLPWDPTAAVVGCLLIYVAFAVAWMIVR